MNDKAKELRLNKRVWITTDGADFLIGARVLMVVSLDYTDDFLPQEIAKGIATARFDETTTKVEVMNAKTFMEETEMGRTMLRAALDQLYENLKGRTATLEDQAALVLKAREEAQAPLAATEAPVEVVG